MVPVAAYNEVLDPLTASNLHGQTQAGSFARERRHYMHKLILASAFALTACGPKLELNKAPPPPDKLVCQEMPQRPDLKPLEAFSLPDGTQAYRKADVDQRDGSIARFIVSLEGAYYDCRRTVDWNHAYWTE